MKKSLYVVCLLALVGSIAWAQEKVERTEIVIQEKQRFTNYYEIRIGAWFPKDMEKEFTVPETNAEVTGTIDQSLALGLDFHFRKELSRPLFFDLALQGWYSSYGWEVRNIPGNLQQYVKHADAWAAVVPLTIGLSVTPLPDNPIQPYAMGGIGLYAGITGITYDVNANQTYARHKDDKELFSFGGYLGAGLDFLFLPKFGVSVAGKYQFCKFKEQLYTGQQDFQGLQLMLGICSSF
jgi:hypothetical protein